MKLLSIEKEAALCRKANAKARIGDVVMHLHHDILCEPLTEPMENRVSFILSYKATHEQATRLHLMRVVPRSKILSLSRNRPEVKEAYAKWQEACAKIGPLLHKHVCKDCPWNGKTIFPREAT